MPVDQHQRRVEREAAQRHAAGATGQGPAEILRERAAVICRNSADDISDRVFPALLDFLGTDDLHRRGSLGSGKSQVRARHHDGFKLIVARRCRSCGKQRDQATQRGALPASNKSRIFGAHRRITSCRF